LAVGAGPSLLTGLAAVRTRLAVGAGPSLRAGLAVLTGLALLRTLLVRIGFGAVRRLRHAFP
jgi:hypothetical protein